MDKIISFAKKNWILILILIVGAVCRLYRIGDYMTFLGDEGRDVIIVRNLLVHADPILIGPGTSIGNMYLGPLYYYMMAPALLLANFSPVGPAIQIAILGIITIYFIYVVGKEFFGEKVGLISALLYSLSPTVIIYSRSSWNPNIMPFFALLTIYSIYKIYKGENRKWLLVCGASFAAVLQSHYLGLLLAPTIAIFWYLSKKDQLFKKYTYYGIAIFAFLMSPLLIFDLRHNFLNSRALYKFLTVRQETVSIKPWTSLTKIPVIFNDINSSLLSAKNLMLAKWATIILSISFVYELIRNRKKLNSKFYLLFSWLVFGLIGLGLYKQQIYDHYYGFLFPVIFLFVGYFISKLNKYLGVIVVLVLVFVNLQNNPLRFEPSKQLKRSQDVANLILDKSANKPFDLAVLAERNYEDGYRYFLEVKGATVLHADKWDQKTIVDQLFVVCEMEEKKCDPTHSPKAEVANFGMTKIDEKWSVDGVIIYKLSHTK